MMPSLYNVKRVYETARTPSNLNCDRNAIVDFTRLVGSFVRRLGTVYSIAFTRSASGLRDTSDASEVLNRRFVGSRTEEISRPASPRSDARSFSSKIFSTLPNTRGEK